MAEQNGVNRTELVQLELLKPHPRNYRSHPPDQIEHLIESIRSNGIYRNIVIARDNTILAGHGVAQALKEMGLELVPAVRLDIDPEDPRALKVLTGDNEIAGLVEVDDRELTELLKEISADPEEGLLGSGYDDMMLANLLYVTRSSDEIRDLDEAAHWVGMPEYDEGQYPPQLLLSFRNEEDRERLVRQLDLDTAKRGQRRVWTATWPDRKEMDKSSIRFVEEVVT
jgi:hypothetical protein